MYRLKEGKISSNGIFGIIVILIITKVFLGIPRVAVQEGGSASWLLLLMSAGIASAGVFIIVKLIKKFPDKNIVDIAETLWGPPGRVIVAAVMASIFLYISTVVVREFAETILTTVLPRTPISIVTLMFVITMVLGAYNGLEVITRSVTLLIPFILVGITSILLLAGSFIDLNNFFPLLGTGIDKLVVHAPGRSSIYIDIVMVTLIISNVNEPEKIPQQVWKGFLFSTAVFVVVQLFYVSILTIHAGSKLYIPLFQLARIIYMGRFVQRIEVLYVFVWFFTGALQLTLTLYGAVTALSRGFKIPIYQPLLFPLGLLVFSLSFVPQSTLHAVSLDMNILRKYGSLIGFGVPAALLLTSVVLRKGGKTGEKQKTN